MLKAENTTRDLDCPRCGTLCVIPLEAKWTHGRKDICPTCGVVLVDADYAAEVAAERLTLEEAAEIMQRYTWDEVMGFARQAWDDQRSLNPDQIKALYAFCRLRSMQAGMN